MMVQLPWKYNKGCFTTFTFSPTKWKPTKNTNTSLTSFGRLKNSWKQIKLSVWILYILTFNSLHVYFWQITCNKYIKIQLVAVKIWSRSHSKMCKFFWLQSHPIQANSNMNNVCLCYQFTVPKWNLLFLYISGIDSYFSRACFIFPWGIKSVFMDEDCLI
jgi:hypothetical protein